MSRLLSIALCVGTIIGVTASPLHAAGATGFRDAMSSGTAAHGTGALRDPISIAPRRAAGATASPAVDLSSWVVPVGDQGSIGSCVTWAINYAMMGWYSRHEMLAAGGISFAPMYVYSQTHVSNSPDGGGSFSADAYNLASDQGVDTQSDYWQGNYDFTDLPTASEKVNASGHKSGAFSYLYSGIPGTAADSEIKAAVTNHQPVAIMLPVYPAFDALNGTNYHLDASQILPSDTSRGTHEILIVGYDATGVRVQNSWGTGWGDGGFANLDWNFIEQYTYEATVMSGLIKPPSGMPDLVVSSLKWSPTTPTTGDAVKFTATIKNQGTAATPNGVKHGVAFMIDGKGVSWSDNDTASLSPGSSITLTANGGPKGTSTWRATSGSHTAQAVVDDSKLITESNETNNTLSESLPI